MVLDNGNLFFVSNFWEAGFITSSFMKTVPWTLSALMSPSSGTREGDDVSIVATSSMLERSPLTNETNKVHAIIGGSKVELNYSGQDSSNNSKSIDR